MRPIPTEAVDLVARWEGLELEAYPDPATGGEPWTIGYGHTGGVKPGDRVTKEQARQMLRVDLETAAAKLERRIGADIVAELTDHQYAALLSFVFNLGVDGSMAKATIWKRLKARQFDQVHLEFAKFVNANGRKLQGLVNRRADEQRVWSTNEPGTETVRFTSAQLREMDTSATPADPVPAKKSATIWAAISAFVLGVLKWIGDMLAQIPDFANTALNAINPFAQKSEWAQAVVNGLGGLAAVAGLYVAWSVVKKKGEARR